jgi:hypothetical protein
MAMLTKTLVNVKEMNANAGPTAELVGFRP